MTILSAHLGHIIACNRLSIMIFGYFTELLGMQYVLDSKDCVQRKCLRGTLSFLHKPDSI